MNKKIVATLSVFILAILALALSLAFFSPVNRTPPAPEIFSYDENYYRGGFMFDLSKSTRDHEVDHSFLVGMDSSGNYAFSRRDELAYHDYPNLLEEGQLFYLLSGRRENPHLQNTYVWDPETGELREVFTGVDFSGHHELLIEDQYFVTLGKAEKGGLDTIIRRDLDGSETILWSSEALYDAPPCPLCQRPNDWLHSNDVTKSLDGLYYYVNLRAANSIAKIEIESGSLVWICGMDGDFNLYNENGDNVSSLWYHSHIIKEVEPNTFVMFDNDLHNRSKMESYPEFSNWFDSSYGGESRLIEFTVDETNKEARLTWTFSPGEEYYCSGFGDIDVLPNGNILGTFGLPAHDKNAEGEETGNPFGAAILEVTRTGELVREYRFPYGYAIYRLQLLDPAEYAGEWLLDEN